MMVIGGGIFGEWLGHEGRGIMNETSALIKGTKGGCLALSPHEDIVRRWLSMNQKAVSY